MSSDLVFEMAHFVPGVLAVVADSHKVRHIYFRDSRSRARQQVHRDYPTACQRQGRITTLALQQIGEYFAGRRWHFDLPLSTDRLSQFSQQVHTVLRRIPPGTTISYSELGAMAGFPRAARAVGRVMASNPFPIVVPCHRVVCADGRLGAYSAANGPATKRWLLAFEQNHRAADTH